eukprot:SAG11_NODE_4966_length_1707_cov_4.374767_1_plen_92_part_00
MYPGRPTYDNFPPLSRADPIVLHLGIGKFGMVEFEKYEVPRYRHLKTQITRGGKQGELSKFRGPVTTIFPLIKHIEKSYCRVATKVSKSMF